MKSKKSKNNSQAGKRPENTPAYFCFCDPFGTEGPYEWISWALVIRHLREYIGMDQTVFGLLLQGYTRGQIGRYEKGETEPPLDFWAKMMRAFGLSVNWALTGQGLPYISEYQDCEERKRYSKWAVLMTEREGFLKELHGWDQRT